MANDQFNMNATDEPCEPFERPASHLRKALPIKSNLILVVMFVAGIATVYLLSLRSGPRKASAQQIEVERKVDIALEAMKVLPSKRGEAKNLINTFYYEMQQRQIPISHLKGNPFTFLPPDTPVPKLDSRAPDKVVDHSPAPDAKKERDDALKAAGELKLESVLMGTRTMAMISNNLLARGQQISGWTIVEIRSREVVLKWRGETYVLKMPE